jgi:cytochrome oxidase Cu insertion factor (SCO1/SenC/PrrC family)
MSVKQVALSFALVVWMAGLAVAVELPRKAQELDVTVPGSPPIKLSQYRGKAVVLTFILTTCPHCQRTVQILSGIQKELGPKGLQVVAAAINPDADIPGFNAQFHPAFPVGTVDRTAVAGFMQLTPTARALMPFVVFIDRNGEIREQYTGADEYLQNEDQQEPKIRASIQKLLKK